MKIRELQSADASSYREMMARALVEHASSFRISPEDEGEPLVPFSVAPPGDFTLGAFGEDGQLLGVVSFQRETRRKLRHKGTLYRMYVHAGAARKGVGRHLVREVIRRVALLDGLEQLNLTVVSANTAAKALYTSEGFETFALERNGLKSGDAYLDEEQMCLRVNARARP